jgi:hypothetical protein
MKERIVQQATPRCAFAAIEANTYAGSRSNVV